MSSTSSPRLDDFINRGVEMLRDNTGGDPDTTLFLNGYPPTVDNQNLITNVLAQEPPIDQSPNIDVVPIIYVGYSRNPIRRMEYIGRDTIDVAGARNYFLEFYNVIITRGLTKEDSLKKCQLISNIVRDIYQKNLRMTDPSDDTSPIAATNEVIAVPFVLRTDNVTIQAINVICRPQVRVSLR